MLEVCLLRYHSGELGGEKSPAGRRKRGPSGAQRLFGKANTAAFISGPVPGPLLSDPLPCGLRAGRALFPRRSSGRLPGAGQCGQMPASNQPQAQGEEEDGDGTKGELTALHAGGCSTIISHNFSRECPGGQRTSSHYGRHTDRQSSPEAGTWPALSGNHWSQAGGRIMGLAASQIQWHRISKRYFPGCKLRPSASETRRRTVYSLQMKKVGERWDFTVLFSQCRSDQPAVDGTGSYISQPVEMLSSASASRHTAGLCHECPCPCPCPAHLPWEKLEFLCSETAKEGWGTRRKQEFPKISRPTLVSEALPLPSSFPGVSWTTEIRPGLWVPGIFPAGRPGLLGLPTPTVNPNPSIS